MLEKSGVSGLKFRIFVGEDGGDRVGSKNTADREWRCICTPSGDFYCVRGTSGVLIQVCGLLRRFPGWQPGLDPAVGSMVSLYQTLLQTLGLVDALPSYHH